MRSFAGCFDTSVYNDVAIEDVISKFTLNLTRLESNIALTELKVFVGRATSLFHSSNLEQDSSRTWLVFNKTGLTTLEIDELDVRGNAHLAIQSNAGHAAIRVNQYKGDFTATIHVGGQQKLYLNASNNSVIPFTLRTYQVGWNLLRRLLDIISLGYFLTFLACMICFPIADHVRLQQRTVSFKFLRIPHAYVYLTNGKTKGKFP